MKKLLLLSVLLVGCTDTPPVTTSELMAKANEVCVSNQGVNYILNGQIDYEYQHCGSRCVRRTGMVISSGTVVCNNQGSFDVSVSTFKEKLKQLGR